MLLPRFGHPPNKYMLVEEEAPDQFYTEIDEYLNCRER
jgi:hypothetical protein